MIFSSYIEFVVVVVVNFIKINMIFKVDLWGKEFMCIDIKFVSIIIVMVFIVVVYI